MSVSSRGGHSSVACHGMPARNEAVGLSVDTCVDAESGRRVGGAVMRRAVNEARVLCSRFAHLVLTLRSCLTTQLRTSSASALPVSDSFSTCKAEMDTSNELRYHLVASLLLLLQREYRLMLLAAVWSKDRVTRGGTVAARLRLGW